MPVRNPFRRRWLEIVTGVCILTVLAALLFQWPHWREWSGESCHLCGNRRTIVQHFRWWRHDGTSIREYNEFTVPAGHVHDWWRYGFGKVSPTGSFAAESSARYRDGRVTWHPPHQAPPTECRE
ncbi:MAG: hypothetical protein WD066_12810 [Planctomycetaceae bacterium]